MHLKNETPQQLGDNGARSKAEEEACPSVAPAPKPIAEENSVSSIVGPGETEVLLDLKRFGILRAEEHANLSGLEFEGARSRFRRLLERGFVSQEEAPGRLVYYALTQAGAELLQVSWKKPVTAHRAIFEKLAISEFSAESGATLLLSEELEFQLAQREQETGTVLRVPGLHKTRFLLSPVGDLSQLLIEVGAIDRNLFSFLASIRRKANTLAQKSEGWRQLLEQRHFSYTLLCAHAKRPKQLLDVSRRLKPRLSVGLNIFVSERLLQARGVK